MPYWGNDIDGNDYAFDSIGMYVVMIRDRMFEDAMRVCQKPYPEQSIGVSLRCIRAIHESFPKSVRVVFGRRELAQCRELFERWCSVALEGVPDERREAVRVSTMREIEMLEDIMKPKKRHGQ